MVDFRSILYTKGWFLQHKLNLNPQLDSWNTPGNFSVVPKDNTSYIHESTLILFAVCFLTDCVGHWPLKTSASSGSGFFVLAHYCFWSVAPCPKFSPFIQGVYFFIRLKSSNLPSQDQRTQIYLGHNGAIQKYSHLSYCFCSCCLLISVLRLLPHLFTFTFSLLSSGLDRGARSPRLKSVCGVCTLYPLLSPCHKVMQKKHSSTRPFHTPAKVMVPREP